MNPPDHTQRLANSIAGLVSTIIEIVNERSKQAPAPEQPETTAVTTTQAGIPLQNEKSLPRLAFTMRETAEILGVSYVTVRRLIQRGLLKSSGAVRHKIIPRTEIERFLKQTVQ